MCNKCEDIRDTPIEKWTVNLHKSNKKEPASYKREDKIGDTYTFPGNIVYEYVGNGGWKRVD